MPDSSVAALGAMPSRIKRNTACTSCRDAKVRCNPSSQPGRPCQRCAKLGQDCVVDRTHKRVSRRSKFDELVQEIQTIKKTVNDRSSQPPAPIPIPCGFPQHQAASPFKTPETSRIGLPSPGASRPAPSTTTAFSTTPIAQTPATTHVSDVHVEPSLPRALDSQPFSGEDIDYYFQMYFEHFHPYMPIIRHRDPNKVYESGSLLFWVIILIATRRYAKDNVVFSTLMGTVQKELRSACTDLPLPISTVNALILMCTWVFPNIRFINDPTPMYSAAASTAAMLLGIHTGKGGHHEFSFGMFQTNFTDEEAVYTWAGYNITSQRISAYIGVPPHGCLFNQTIQNVIDGRTPFNVPSDFRVLLECQTFSNRVSKTMASCLDETRGVSRSIVRLLEDEFDKIQGLICSERADDLDHLNALLVRLEIQTYYLLPLPGYDPEALRRDVLRTYTTAQEVITSTLELDRKRKFLLHLPHFYFRSIIAATGVINMVLRSSYADFLDKSEGERLAADCISVCRGTTVLENDLPLRMGSIMQSVWGRGLSQLPKWSEVPISTFTHRLGASIMFECLRRWKDDQTHLAQLPPPAEGAEPSAVLTGEPFPNIDWSFMDDFDWNFEPNLLAPAP